MCCEMLGGRVRSSRKRAFRSRGRVSIPFRAQFRVGTRRSFARDVATDKGRFGVLVLYFLSILRGAYLGAHLE